MIHVFHLWTDRTRNVALWVVAETISLGEKRIWSEAERRSDNDIDSSFRELVACIDRA